jgi:ketosteroid isomerase-like protein
MMSIESVRSVVERFLEYDYSVLADDVVGEAIGLGIKVSGPSGVEAAVEEIYQQIFNAEPENKALHISETCGVLEYDVVGTHTGAVPGIAPTGRSVRLPCVSVYEVRDGKISAIRAYFPLQSLLEPGDPS